jgi:hypothetical protein
LKISIVSFAATLTTTTAIAITTAAATTATHYIPNAASEAISTAPSLAYHPLHHMLMGQHNCAILIQMGSILHDCKIQNKLI